METESLISKPISQLKEIFFDLDRFMEKANPSTIHYEIVNMDKAREYCDVLYLSAISKDGSHIVKFEKAVRPTVTSYGELEKIAKDAKAILGRWCW